MEPLEDHIAELRADKEIAFEAGADGWVLTNFDEQIRAFTRVAQNMREHLEGLQDDERAVVDAACTTMNKVRQADAFIPLGNLRVRPSGH